MITRSDRVDRATRHEVEGTPTTPSGIREWKNESAKRCAGTQTESSGEIGCVHQKLWILPALWTRMCAICHCQTCTRTWVSTPCYIFSRGVRDHAFSKYIISWFVEIRFTISCCSWVVCAKKNMCVCTLYLGARDGPQHSELLQACSGSTGGSGSGPDKTTFQVQTRGVWG